MEHDFDKENWYLEDIEASATDDKTGGWYINKNCNLYFLYEHVSTPSAGVGSHESGNPYLSLEALMPLHIPLMSWFVTDKLAEDIKGAFFEVLARRRNQKSLHFGRCRDSAWKYVSPDYETYTPEFSKYHPNAQLMMQRWGYNLDEKPGLN